MGYLSNQPGTKITLEEEIALAQLSDLGNPLDILRVNSTGDGLEYAPNSGGGHTGPTGPTGPIGPTGPSGGGSPASPDTSIQYNNAGAFGGTKNFEYLDATREIKRLDSSIDSVTVGFTPHWGDGYGRMIDTSTGGGFLFTPPALFYSGSWTYEFNIVDSYNGDQTIPSQGTWKTVSDPPNLANIVSGIFIGTQGTTGYPIVSFGDGTYNPTRPVVVGSHAVNDNVLHTVRVCYDWDTTVCTILVDGQVSGSGTLAPPADSGLPFRIGERYWQGGIYPGVATFGQFRFSDIIRDNAGAYTPMFNWTLDDHTVFYVPCNDTTVIYVPNKDTYSPSPIPIVQTYADVTNTGHNFTNYYGTTNSRIPTPAFFGGNYGDYYFSPNQGDAKNAYFKVANNPDFYPQGDWTINAWLGGFAYAGDWNSAIGNYSETYTATGFNPTEYNGTYTPVIGGHNGVGAWINENGKYMYWNNNDYWCLNGTLVEDSTPPYWRGYPGSPADSTWHPGKQEAVQAGTVSLADKQGWYLRFGQRNTQHGTVFGDRYVQFHAEFVSGAVDIDYSYPEPFHYGSFRVTYDGTTVKLYGWNYPEPANYKNMLLDSQAISSTLKVGTNDLWFNGIGDGSFGARSVYNAGGLWTYIADVFISDRVENTGDYVSAYYDPNRAFIPQVLNSHLMGYWRFQELGNKGDVLDVSGNGNTGVLTNGSGNKINVCTYAGIIEQRVDLPNNIIKAIPNAYGIGAPSLEIGDANTPATKVYGALTIPSYISGFLTTDNNGAVTATDAPADSKYYARYNNTWSTLNQYSWKTIPSGLTVTIPANQQMIVDEEIKLIGELDAVGELVILGNSFGQWLYTKIPAVPTGLAVVGVRADSVDLNWDSMPNTLTYTLFRDGTVIYAGSGTSFIDTGLVTLSTYNYTVLGTNIFGSSVQSSKVTTKTTPFSGPNYAVSFVAGGDARVTVPYSSSFFGNGSWTYEWWMQAPSQDDPLIIDNSSGNTLNGFLVQMSGGTRLIFYFGTSSGLSYVAAVMPWSTGVHHIALTLNSATNTGHIFFDGIEQTPDHSDPYTEIIDSGSPFYIGSSPHYGTGVMTGTISEMRVSSVVRYTSNFIPDTSFTPDADTVGYWKFNEDTGITAHDSSGNGFDGTLGGTPLPTWIP